MVVNPDKFQTKSDQKCINKIHPLASWRRDYALRALPWEASVKKSLYNFKIYQLLPGENNIAKIHWHRPLDQRDSIRYNIVDTVTVGGGSDERSVASQDFHSPFWGKNWSYWTVYEVGVKVTVKMQEQQTPCRLPERIPEQNLWLEQKHPIHANQHAGPENHWAVTPPRAHPQDSQQGLSRVTTWNIRSSNVVICSACGGRCVLSIALQDSWRALS